ncbi:MarR family winged helix-turn-helix transcriptional regulator [Klenkia taihuensis]|uniref:DNA-binding transcriptional regulator, MarR family n=1 Tax=Klenkia taihuensis TaxID=1225127 RepID=A0A1I1UB17_9ACTN|nr:MarR family transcriptional regulator [Klenkia taihuensis]GHE06962.1 transcriptional regulator [Klenkia taihuensis]SFD65120.1 DNA-binding transcriptional regulator, MarR family [Klenkia taihuensis]
MSPSAPEDDALISTFGRLVEVASRLTRSVGARLEAEHDLPLAWLEVLLRLTRSPDGRLTMAALADQISLTSGGGTRLVSRMVDAGLVERVPCPTDRRVVYASVTERGRERVAQAWSGHAAALREVFAPLGAAGLDAFDDLLDRLRTTTPGTASRP